MFPCRNGIAVYRLHKGRDLTYVKSELVHEYHKFAYVKETFRQNIFPVSMDSLTLDGTTRPPIVKKQTAGHPKTKKFEIKMNMNWEMILQSSALTAVTKAITRGLVQTPKPRLPKASQVQI
jgi:hypothetical protein